MATENNFKTLDEIVFENRNKEYGAYDLRRAERPILTKAFLIGTAAFVMLICAPVLIKFITGGKAKKEVAVEIDLADVNQVEEKKEEEKPKEEEKIPPKQEETAQVKMIIPEPKPDNQVKKEETIPEKEDTENKDLGATNREGKESSGDTGGGVASEGPKVAAPQVTEKPVVENNAIVDNPDMSAEYKGNLNMFMTENLDVEAASEDDVYGVVEVTFVVDKDGTIADIKVSKPLSKSSEREVIRVIKMTSKRWSPGLEKGEKVKSRFRIPVRISPPEE